jgi:DNA modification methylase
LKSAVAKTRAEDFRNSCAFLLLKADALHIPLAANSVDLVIATPPFAGEKRFHRREFCSTSLDKYAAMTQKFMCEALRIVRPSGYILFHTSTSLRPMPKIFDVFQKRKMHGGWIAGQVDTERHFVRNVSVRNFCWKALPVPFYRDLIERYSHPGDAVLHVFSGCGNGGLAAIASGRKAILLDLYYHRLVKHRVAHHVSLCTHHG